MTTVSYPNGVTERRTYDPAGQLTEVSTSRPQAPIESYSYSYDERGFRTEQVEQDGATTRWSYDPAGRLIRVEYPADKIRAIREAAGAEIERVRPRDGAGNEQQGSPGSGLIPDAPGPETSAAGNALPALSLSALSTISRAGHELRPLGNGQGQGSGSGQGAGNGGGQDSGTGAGQGSGGSQGGGNGQNNGNGNGGQGGNGADYKAAGETVSVTPGYTVPVREWVEYEYDADGNRVRETSDLGETEYAYDPANRLLRAGDISFSYDAAGRLVRRTAGDETDDYTYDAAGRLRKIGLADGSGVTYGYDAFGRKVTRTAAFWSAHRRRGPSEQGLSHGQGFEQGNHNGEENGQAHQNTPRGLAKPYLETETTLYLWDGLRVLAEYTETGAPLGEYYAVGDGGAGDRILARKMFGLKGRKEPGTPDLQTTGGLLYYTYDGLGNVTGLTDRLGGLVKQYRYDAFGGLLTSATAPYNLLGPFGKEFDPAAGLVYFGARWYDASVGRFVTPDPIHGRTDDPITLNRYLFARANPVNFVDRWGLHPEDPYYEITNTPDVVDVYVRVLIGQLDVGYPPQEYRTVSKVYVKEVHKHYHKYDVWEYRRERRVRGDGSDYWEVIKDEVYTTDWVWKYTEIGWTVIDLIAQKEERLLSLVGTAPTSSGRDLGGGEPEVLYDIAGFAEGFAREYINVLSLDAWEAFEETVGIEPLFGDRPAYEWGELFGAFAGVIAGLAEIAGGFVAGGFGITITVGSAGTAIVVGASATAGGVVLIGVGIGTVALGLSEVSERLPYLFSSSGSSGSTAGMPGGGVPKPNVGDPELRKIMDYIYRPGAKVGAGSTADAVRWERETGQLVGGRSHTQKAQECVRALEKWLSTHPNASPSDMAAAEAVLRDLRSALAGN